ncbi:MAG: tryptophan--tRNA ligase, partial [Nanoarchaeota archaeon]|nr:tryptophan--tRNA ligase [Nanoarchaeota archaeon]
KPCIIHAKFMSPLTGATGKSSSSGSSKAILMTDDAKTVKNKINKYAFSGGKETVEEHRKLGGNIEVDVACQWLKYFEHDDKKLAEIYNKYSKGQLLSGEVKAILIEKINKILSEHQKRRATAEKQFNKFIYKN